MSWADQFIYPRPTKYINTGTVIEGYTRKEVEGVARKAAEETRRYWEEKMNVHLMHKLAFRDALDGIISGRLAGDDRKAIQRYIDRRKYELAEERGFDLKAAETLFFGSPRERERENARRKKVKSGKTGSGCSLSKRILVFAASILKFAMKFCAVAAALLVAVWFIAIPP